MKEDDIRLLMEISPDREHLLPGWQRGVEVQRAKTVKAGDLLYCRSYPIWDHAARKEAESAMDKARQRKGTSAAQKRLDARKAEDKLIQIINANFGVGDHLVTCTYARGKEPRDLAEAKRHMSNYMARVKRAYRKAGLPEPRYVYVTEVTTSNRWGVRYHHHMVLQGGLPRATVEELWTKKHGICNTKSAQRQKEGLTGWAKYIAKQVCGEAKADLFATRHRWSASKGLTVPQPTTADKKISRRRVERIAQAMERDPDVAKLHLEACYPGYEVLEMTVRTSEWVRGAYIYATLCRKEDTYGNHQARRRGNHRQAGQGVCLHPLQLRVPGGGQGVRR